MEQEKKMIPAGLVPLEPGEQEIQEALDLAEANRVNQQAISQFDRDATAILKKIAGDEKKRNEQK